MKALHLIIAMTCLNAYSSAQQPDENLALGKKYRMEPRPNYRYCTDPDDATQLTDGQYVKGYFWTQPGCVGWSNTSPVSVTIDLGKILPIAGASFNTAAGKAGVSFPAAILILVSDDGKAWRLAGDLIELSARKSSPPANAYAVHRYATHELAARGRFVKLMISPAGPYAFVDEIEVYRGPDELLTRPMSEPGIADPNDFFDRMRIDISLRRRLNDDLKAVRDALAAPAISPAIRQSVAAELDAIAREIPAARVVAAKDFKTIFPITDLHGRIFAAQAALWRQSGIQGVIAWPSRRWDMLRPTDTPVTTEPAVIRVAMMNNEFRSAAFNLSNAGEKEAAVSFAVQGLPGGANPAYLTVHEVPFTDTQSGAPVAAALPVIAPKDGKYNLTIVPGLTRQIWLTLHPVNMPAEEYRGNIVLESATAKAAAIPINLKVFPFTFPDQPTLHLGGWDYTNSDRCYEVTPENRVEFIRHLREHFVDTPWGQSSVMPAGKHGADGRMIQPPDPSAFSAWRERWPNARNYYVFASMREKFAGFPMGDARFKQAVTDWINWWVGQLKSWNIQPRQLGLLLVDEPHAADQDRIIIEYAKVIRAAQPEVVIWEDVTWQNPAAATPELFEVSHVLCPNLPMWIAQGPKFADFYIRQREAGRHLWFYSCSGPGRLLDPYSYHRLQHWYCWKYGAEGSGFWAFGDSNGASSWNEYGSRVGAYTPLFLDAATVTPGKHMESIREGIEDYEYLRMLQDRVVALEKQGTKREAIASARRLLDTAADRVLVGDSKPEQMYWREPKDRSIADQVRMEILETLARLAEIK